MRKALELLARLERQELDHERRSLRKVEAELTETEHEAFFTGLLGDVEEPTAPFEVLDLNSTGVAEAYADVDAETASTVRELARRSGVSTAAVFHLAWALVLSRLTGRDDVVFGSAVSTLS